MKLALGVICLLIFVACSTEKNRLINRSYHGLTAHYNGYFNANELINQSVNTYRASLKEDYYSVLPLAPVPNEEEVKSFYPAIDTAISKCTKVISKHSMPTASEPSKKKAEHNKWIDENWMTIGISNYYRRDYEGAVKNFNYVRKFFQNDPSKYTATVWMAKSYIQINNLTEASILIQELDKDIEELKELAESKSSKSEKKGTQKKKKKSKKSKKKGKKEEVKAEMPRKTRFLLELTRADLQLAIEDQEKAIEALENSLKFAKKSKDKARIHYVLAQLNGQQNQNEKAAFHYSKVLRYNATFEMDFNARINRALMGGDAKIRKELEKMLRDEKNAEFKDQIYYALAEIEFKSGNVPKGKELLNKSIIFSVTNNRQKAMSYEKLGDLSFADRSYIVAQKYYDSCAKVLPDNYPNADAIRNKATKLKDLVQAVETAAYEDSVQRIAGMSESDRLAFAEKLVKKIAEEEKLRKQREEEQLKILQAQQTALLDAQSSTKFFWNNAKLKSEGLESFRKQWGARDNEDDWRRSEKISMASFTPEEEDTAAVAEPEVEKEDSLTAEKLLANLPINDSLMSASMSRMLTALYDAGIIYKDQLNERDMAIKQFETILERGPQSNFKLLALYQLYKMFETLDPSKAYAYKQEILTNYPESDYANYLRDPDYFVKQKELEKLNEEDYLKLLDRYNRGLYSYVVSASQNIIDTEKNNKYRAKYYLLNALSVGQMTDDKNRMLPILNALIAEFPGSMEEARAKELIELIKNGVSASGEKPVKKNEYIYEFDDKVDHWVILFLDPKENSNLSKSKVADFNKEFYGKYNLNVNSKIYGTDQSIILIDAFDIDQALEYVKTFGRTKKYVDSLRGNKIYTISQANLKKLFETMDLEEYDLFYTEFY